MQPVKYHSRAGGYIIASVLLAKYPILIERDASDLVIKASWTVGGVCIGTGVELFGMLHMRYFEKNYGRR